MKVWFEFVQNLTECKECNVQIKYLYLACVVRCFEVRLWCLCSKRLSLSFCPKRDFVNFSLSVILMINKGCLVSVQYATCVKVQEKWCPTDDEN